MRSTAYFHEDDYCQVELVCEENLEWCLDQTRRISDFANVHAGDDMYLRPAHSVELETRGISVDALATAVAPLQRYDAVTTGYAGIEDVIPNTSAFGASGLVLFASHPNGLVSAIWFALQPADDESVATAIAMFSALSHWRLLLVDWPWGRVMPLTGGAVLDAYLRERRQVAEKITANMLRDRKERTTWLGRIRQWLRG